jgi:hypothetical protein
VRFNDRGVDNKAISEVTIPAVQRQLACDCDELLVQDKVNHRAVNICVWQGCSGEGAHNKGRNMDLFWKE